MIIDDQHYDVIIIGSGAGGGTLAHKLAHAGKQILILERGDFMPLSEQNRTNVDVFKRERYHAPEQWYDQVGEPFSPQTNYAIGGNTKIYGATLMRMRSRDFEAVPCQQGLSPQWELSYADFEPYYTAAEQLYQVHGSTDQDPSEPFHSQAYPYPAPDHDLCMQAVIAALGHQALHPAALPLSLTRQAGDPTGDAEVFGIQPILSLDNVTLKTGALVTYLHTNPSGQVVKAVEATIGNQDWLFSGDIVVLACGAINSAALLLKSANDRHPHGLANSSDQVGRNLMKHQMSAVVQLSTETNSGTFPRSVSINDYYWGDQNYDYPMGHIQNTGGLLQDVIFAESPPVLSLLAKVLPGFGLKQLAYRSIGWWVQTEVLPDPNNRVLWDKSKLRVEFTPNNTEAHDRLVVRWIDILQSVEKQIKGFHAGGLHPRGEAPIQVVAHQCGTCRFGTDRTQSVLNLECQAHEIDNLYVVDSSFFPSCPSVSPALTVIANALRVGDHLITRLEG